MMPETKKVILIVEDEKPLQAAIRLKLEKSGFDTITARTVKQAFDYLQETGRVDVIWLDHYLLGRETGLDLIAKIKNNKEWKKIPIFVISNTAGPEKKASYIRFGVARYFTKADNRLDVIVDEIKKYIERGEEK